MQIDIEKSRNLLRLGRTEDEVHKIINILMACKESIPIEPPVILETADKPYSIYDILKYLADAAWILLYKKDYDGDDYEEIEICHKKAREIIEKSSLSN